MKRTIALLLTAALTMCAGIPTHAAGRGTGGQTRTEAAEGLGQVDVSIGAALKLNSPVEFSVRLTDAQNKTLTDTYVLGDGSSEGGRRSFEGLARGEYTLTVSARGFADYTQKISVEDKAYAVNLTTGFLSGVNYEAGAAHPGVLLIGDVNGDGRIDMADRTELVDAIDGAVSPGRAGSCTDLNGDGAVNLVDLDYFARGYNVTKDTLAQIERFVPAAAITPQGAAGTRVEGDLGELLRNKSSVTLTPAGGGAISQESPVSLEFSFSDSGAAAMADGIIIETGGDNPIGKALVEVSYTDGSGALHEEKIPVADVHYLLNSSQVRVERDGQGNIQIHLGSQVAVKKVTLTIVGMQKNNNLAEISKVEFVNGMEERIPEPEMDIPTNLSASVGSKRISLTWDACVNVTGYEVLIKQGDTQEIVSTVRNALDITSFGGKELTNYLEYRIRVQSVNGTWSSGYGEEVTAVPKPNGKPDKPDNVKAVGKHQSIVVSWKNMKDTVSYNLYYKESSAGEYTKIEGIEGSSYTLEGLKELTEYTVYVTGVNEFGESDPSLSAAATTTDMNPAVMPKYNLINVGEPGKAGAHIESTTMWGSMKDSPLDTQSGTAWGTVDHNPASYYLRSTWDDGGFNPMGKHGLVYEFDQSYKIDTIAFQEAVPQSPAYSYVKVRYWDENGTQTDVAGSKISLQQKQDGDGRIYYVLKLSEPINAKKIQFGLARYVASGTVTVSEVYFYYYDTLMEEIMSLYADDLHTVLKAGVTQATIDGLRVKINTVDEVSGEYHPDRELLERELQTAEAILHDAGLKDSVEIHGGISTNDVGRGFGGLNAWQPLGIVAAAQEELMVYVGHGSKKTGQDTELQLVATQYHAEASAFSSTVVKLKVGANKVTIPKIWTTTGFESGGALYVQYTGGNPDDRYAVRVSGGVQVPVLDLYQVTDESERLARAEAYVTELESYVSRMQENHGQFHQNSGNSLVAYSYDERNCILGASDILLDTMMLSLPANQILSGAGSGSAQEKARKILNSMDSMEDMMYLFYQHKGLNRSAAEAQNQIPKGHLNIRYQRMFSGAFMYASGNHIGIEWPETAGMVSSSPVVADSEGRYQSGAYFGWGIAHEIGHCINQGTYAVAEVTNNYFAVLAQAKDRNDSVRFKYEEVYKKVTSGARGSASNVFTQLGMYWQLHLAYDRGYNYKTYAGHEEQLANLFFARVDTYARNVQAAPAPGGVALTLAGDRDQDLMRLSCAAAEKNVLEFFERWGKTPDSGTRSYAEQFATETRAICYVNDDARVYTLQGGSSSLGTQGDVEAVGDDTGAFVNPGIANQVDFTLSSKGIPQEDVLGYEIVRCTFSGGEIQKEPVGFATGNTFSDVIYSMNNRTVFYEITLIDKYLNRSAVKTLETIKISHDGSLDKTFWTAVTQNLACEDDALISGNKDSLCTPGAEEASEKVIGIRKALDNDAGTVYTATADGNGEITLEFNKTLTVSGFKFTAGDGSARGGYEISVRSAGEWIKVAEGSFAPTAVNTVYFANEDGRYVSTYSTDALKLVLRDQGGAVSIAELDVLGVTGDNVDFRYADDGTAAIGRLTQDYRYGEGEGDVIPAGSIVFTGMYKGNPAYNAVILYDQSGNIVGGMDETGNLKAQQIILADVPDQGEIQNVSDGTWIYWIEPSQQTDMTGTERVRAELYRVNNALTNEGQRLVSDSLFMAMPAPDALPDITLGGGAVQE